MEAALYRGSRCIEEMSTAVTHLRLHFERDRVIWGIECDGGHLDRLRELIEKAQWSFANNAITFQGKI